MTVRYPPTPLKMKFERIFKVGMMTYYDPIYGFDIVKFDDEVIKPIDNESCADKIEREHGKNAVIVITQLLEYPKQ